MDLHETISAILQDSFVELMNSFGLTMPVDDAPSGHEPEPGFAAVIGYSEPNLRGSLVLIADLKPLVQTLPVPVAAGEPVDAFCRDWVAELANQLLGRVKNKLLRWGVAINLSTPSVVRGVQLAYSGPSASRGANGVTLTCCSGGNGFRVWLEARAPNSLVLVETPAGAQAEGEIAFL